MFNNEDSKVHRIYHPELQRPPTKNYVKKSNQVSMQSCKISDPKPKKQLKIELSKSEMDWDPKNFSWVLGCLDLERIRDKGIPGIWGAFNSLVSSKVPCKTSVVMVPPLIRAPPTDINVLYSSLMYIKTISKNLNEEGVLTVVTLDMQLYDLAMKLWCSFDHVSNTFLFRPGELHIIFWALASIGDYIEVSGLDQAWVEAGMYSATIVNNQILKGKHVYRSLGCHFVTVISIYTLFFKKCFSQFPDLFITVQTLAEEIRDAYIGDTDSNTETIDELYRIVNEDSGFFERIVGICDKLETIKKNMNPVQIFLLNYVKQFETILIFIKATRDRDIELHLQSPECLIKYFFAHDHLNYARLLPLYLSTMQNIKKTDPKLWKEFEDGKFCVSKSNVKFTSIGSDHGVEQENKRLKVSGGIVGITQQEQALQRFFLAAPVLSALSKDFELKFTEYRDISSKHHDLYGNKPKRMQNNVHSLCRVVSEHGEPFTSQDTRLYNILTHALVTEKVEEEILMRDELGQRIFEEFVVRLDGNISIWSEMKKRKIGSFKQNNKEVKITIEKGKVITLKEERNLLQRFVIIARRRTSLDLEHCIGEYEFGVVPRALFSADGSMLLEKQKYKVATLIKDGVAAEKEFLEIETATMAADLTPNTPTPPVKKVVILDGMAIVNALPKDKDLQI